MTPSEESLEHFCPAKSTACAECYAWMEQVEKAKEVQGELRLSTN